MGNFFRHVAGRFFVLALALSGLWLLLSGYFDKPTLLVFGAVSVLLCTWLAMHVGVLDEEGVPTSVFPGIIWYMAWLMIEIGKANVIVAAKVLSPKISLSPQMVRVKASQKSDLGKVIFANSITLTPGTVSVDLLGDDILVHALTEQLADIGGIDAMGAKVSKLERGGGNPT